VIVLVDIIKILLPNTDDSSAAPSSTLMQSMDRVASAVTVLLLSVGIVDSFDIALITSIKGICIRYWGYSEEIQTTTLSMIICNSSKGSSLTPDNIEHLRQKLNLLFAD
jgi:hypothetical protein